MPADSAQSAFQACLLYTSDYAEIEFDTYVSSHGKEEVEDIKMPMHYYEAGEGEPLILVHGIGQSIYTWRKNFEELAKHFHVFAIDLPGHGFSGKPQMSYSIEEFALSLESFMNVRELASAHFCAFGEATAYVPVSYTHLDVYKRQGLLKASQDGEALSPVKIWSLCGRNS